MKQTFLRMEKKVKESKICNRIFEIIQSHAEHKEKKQQKKEKYIVKKEYAL